jgi:hypothetical protein
MEIYHLPANWWNAGYARMRMRIQIWRHPALAVAA